MHAHSKSLSHTDWRARSLTLSHTHSRRSHSLQLPHSLTHSFTHLQISHTEWIRMECKLTHSVVSHSHKQSRWQTHSRTSHSYTQRWWRAHSPTNLPFSQTEGWRAHLLTHSLITHSREWEVRVKITLTPTPFHTQIRGHTHSLTHSFTHLQISHTEWNANSLTQWSPTLRNRVDGTLTH